jgi:CRISPR/Cas system Type II protein with McrA/HNH and RuvC-like nuclease domain
MKNLANKILQLRNQNHSYSYIASKLNCSKGTVCYYCGNNQKERTLSRNREYKNSHILNKKISRFFSPRKNNQNANTNRTRTIEQKLSSKIRKFGDYKPMFKPKDLLGKIGINPKCYLTGRSIDLNDSKSYHLDHIIPKSKGGDNSLDNCQIACRIANLSKTELTYDEYIALCREIISYADSTK